MPIHFVCPFGHKLVVPDHRAGKKGRCPECEQRVLVPVPNPTPGGPNGLALHAGDGQAVQLDPTDVDELGFDESTTFDQLVAVAPKPRKKKPVEEGAEEAPADENDETHFPSDAAFDESLFQGLPDEPNRPSL